MDKPSLSDRVSSWLETSGRALELRTARAVTRRGGADRVSQSRHYLDPDEDTLREADVVAEWALTRPDGGAGKLVCVCECKSGADKPWVLFDDGQTYFPSDDHKIMDRFVTYESGEAPHDMAHFEQAWVRDQASGNHLGTYEPAAHSLVTALEADKANQPNSAWRSLQQVLSACYGLLPEFLDAGPPPPVIMVPVIVTEAPLFRVYLDVERKAVVSEADFGVIISQSPGGAGLAAVYVMGEQRFERFAGGLRGFTLRTSTAPEV